jgi:hypothetical protein
MELEGRQRMRNSRVRSAVKTGAFIAFAISISACALTGNPPFMSNTSAPTPRVEDCALIQQATPSRYVCGGKVYTAIQLTDIRNGKQVEVK